jgi:hypothetical protein
VEAAAGKAEALIAQLGDDHYGVRSLAFEALAELGRSALKPLRSALDSADPEVSTRAAELLIRIRGRGFLGIGLSEDWEGARPDDSVASDGTGPGAKAGEEDKGDDDLGKDEQDRPPPVVQVTQVLDDFPAQRAGIHTGDKVLAVNGRSISGMYDLMRVVILAGPREPAMVVVEREGRKRAVSVVLSRNPNDPIPPVDLLANPLREEKDGGGAGTDREDDGGAIRPGE